MGISAAFEIGKSGLKLFQVAAEVTSENIANVNTPGYSRQRVLFETAPPTTHNGFPLGTGVRVQVVERYYDSLLQKQLVNAGTTSGYDSHKLGVLQQVEPVFNEIAQDGLGAAMNDFFSAWQDLSINPSGTAERQSVLAKAQIMVDQFHYVSRSITDAITIQNESLSPLVGDINKTLSDIAQLNGYIKNTELVSGNANEMRDQRDYLIRQLAENMQVSFVENDDGTTDISYTDGSGTYALVTGTQAGSLSLAANPVALPDGSTRYDVQLTDAGGAGPTTLAPTTGKLGATVVMRDTVLQGYLDDIDALAAQVATDANGLHATGIALDGTTTGLNFFDPATTSAANISLSGDVLGKPENIAAAQDNFSGDNQNALAIARLNSVNGYSLTYDAMVAQVGLDVQTSQTVVKQGEAFMKQLTTLRDSQSGVSLDEELANLIQYQRSYQASAKLITTATEMMDVVLAMIR
ncbi:flagellar hook-associated protein FlgK [Trichlorobacter sp.]|uniref:flagellar hook-associated protein FlgK n=1 Tax=Trichlorobacter sp. TaxID=2911007 RepID=UPI002A35A8E2|nr:flagellar hook-associated protein FlgK [Trichlorobacter sp.]MDY0383182.1 flagellar hook-associated protein FlgK [Trichlorobacter sp.]